MSKGIKQEYSMEINRIQNYLRDLENGRIYEITGAKMDGSYAKIASNISREFEELLTMIEKGIPSTSTLIFEARQKDTKD
ncbi:hypothetical protein [Sporosarcina sp. FSL K6-1508]|uniref:hypothetical protein n=1 Tax=Sporosarcina sp. FSL K6-1508 TaxID=2921553 RepID=UPI0030F94DC0